VQIYPRVGGVKADGEGRGEGCLNVLDSVAGE